MVRWSDPAKADLRAIHDYIARDSNHYARRVTRDLIDKAASLADLPRLGRVVPELKDDHVREVTAHIFRIIYEILPGDDVVILAVIHKRREVGPGELA